MFSCFEFWFGLVFLGWLVGGWVGGVFFRRGGGNVKGAFLFWFGLVMIWFCLFRFVCSF